MVGIYTERENTREGDSTHTITSGMTHDKRELRKSRVCID